MKTFFAGFLVGAAFLAIAILGYLWLGFAEIRADVPVSPQITRVWETGMHAAVRRTTPALKNPLPSNDETLIAGGKLYLNDCVGCHGAPGQPPSAFGASFYPPARQLAQFGTSCTEAQVFSIAKHGIRRSGMSSQAASYNDQQLWMLAAFIVRLPSVSPVVIKEIQPAPAN